MIFVYWMIWFIVAGFYEASVIRLASTVGSNFTLSVERFVKLNANQSIEPPNESLFAVSIRDPTTTNDDDLKNQSASKYKINYHKSASDNYVSYRLQIEPFEFDDGAKYVTFGQNEISFETIALSDRVNCGTSAINDVIDDDMDQERKKKADDRKMNIITLNLNESMNLYCSIFVKRLVNNPNSGDQQQQQQHDDLLMSWYTNDSLADPNEIHLNLDSNGVVDTQSIVDSREHANTVLYWSKFSLDLRAKTNLEAWKLHNQQLHCHVGHLNYLDERAATRSTAKSTDNLVFFHSRTIRRQLIDKLYCSFHLNINFKPFIHLNVKNIQTFYQRANNFVECPIKANNFPPVKYVIRWSHRNSLNDAWLVKARRPHLFHLAGLLHLDEQLYYYDGNDVNEQKQNGSYFRCELFELSDERRPLLTSVIKVIVYSNEVATSHSSSKTMTSTTGSWPIALLIISLFLALLLVLLTIGAKFKNRLLNYSNRLVPVNDCQLLNDDDDNNEIVFSPKYCRLALASSRRPIASIEMNESQLCYKVIR